MKWSKKKTVVLTVIAVAAIGAGLALRSQSAGADTGMPVSTTPVLRETIEKRLSQKAPLEGTESVEVQSQLHAEVQSILVKEGDRVEKGQLLAVLDSSQLEKQLTLNQAAVDLQQLQMNEALEKAQAEYEAALEQQMRAGEAFEQVQALYAAGSATAKEVEDAQMAKNSADRAVAGFSVSDGKVVASAAEQKAVSNARASLSLSREQLEDCEIRSQIAGTVTRVYTRVGRFADDTEDKKPLFVIENIDNLQMKVMVSEYDIASVQVGQPVEVTADILGGDSVSGVVERISPTGEQKDGGSERVVPVYIRITGTNPKLISGITAKASILLDRAENALTVPFEALAQQPDGSYAVFKLNADNTVTQIPVTLGVENDLRVQVLADGLTETDVIVTNPDGLVDGMAVIPM